MHGLVGYACQSCFVNQRSQVWFLPGTNILCIKDIRRLYTSTWVFKYWSTLTNFSAPLVQALLSLRLRLTVGELCPTFFYKWLNQYFPVSSWICPSFVLILKWKEVSRVQVVFLPNFNMFRDLVAFIIRVRKLGC